jgi:hypothetical protein
MECVRGARHELLDFGFEVLGFLMCTPSIFIKVKFEEKKQQWIGRRPIRNEKFDARFCKRWSNKSPKYGPHGISLTFFGFNRDCHDKPVIQISRAIAGLFHKGAPLM